MVIGAKVCELTDDFLWLVCGLYVGILTSPLGLVNIWVHVFRWLPSWAEPASELHFLKWGASGYLFLCV